MQTRDQKYASGIYEHVKSIAGKDAATANSYGSMAHKLPILIHTSGLIQALTFVNARHKREGEKTGPQLLLEDLSKTVLEDEAADKERLLARARGIMDDRSASLQDYIYLTRQVLAALLWYKRYAQSILGVEQGNNDDFDNPGAKYDDNIKQ